MTDLTTLTEAYDAYNNFREHKEEQRAGFYGEAQATLNAIEEAKLQKRASTAKFDAIIAEGNLKLAQMGYSHSKIQREKDFEDKMREEKSELRKKFYVAAQEAHSAGATYGQMQAAMGVSSLTPIYTAINAPKKLTGGSAATPDKWLKSDKPQLKRYSMSANGGFIRFDSAVDEDDNIVLVYPSLSYYSGDRALQETFRADRAQMLAEELGND